MKKLFYSQKLAPYVFVLPFALTVVIFWLFPIGNGVLLSFQDVLKDKDAKISWTISGSFKEPEENTLDKQPKVDIVIALDDQSLVTASGYSAANNLHGALVYGIGHSTEAIYYLDTGIIRCLVVPDEFSTGYKSLTETAESLKYYFRKMKDITVSYTIIRRDELFSQKNQEIIFTMSQ